MSWTDLIPLIVVLVGALVLAALMVWDFGGPPDEREDDLVEHQYRTSLEAESGGRHRAEDNRPGRVTVDQLVRRLRDEESGAVFDRYVRRIGLVTAALAAAVSLPIYESVVATYGEPVWGVVS